MFEFLYELCGVRVYSADVKVIPAMERLEIPANYAHSYVPTLEYADTDWISPHDRDFSLANGLNGTYSTLEAVDGFKPHKGKRAVIVTLIVLAVAVAPYEVGVLLINTIIFHSQRPTYSIALSALIPMAVIVVDLIILAVKLKKAPRPGKPAEAQKASE